MSTEPAVAARGEGTAAVAPRAKLDLFLISVLILFLELACIRWFPAHVLFLTFFTNTVLLACFLGMSLGCLACNHSRRYLTWTPLLLVLGLAVGLSVELVRGWLEEHVSVGNQLSPQAVYFGTEYRAADLDKNRIPIEAVAGFFFLIITLTLVGPGQELGRALTRVPNRVEAYTINIAGSIAGIVLFAGCSYLQLPPLAWFLPVAVGILYFLGWQDRARFRLPWVSLLVLALALFLASRTSGTTPATPLQPAQGKTASPWQRIGDVLGLRSFGTAEIVEHYWSPYYRIDYEPAYRFIQTNLIGHQAMRRRDEKSDPAYAYSLPHLLDRDSRALAGVKQRSLENVLIIGAGSGNDVSRALQWGAKHIDAVEIDPVIYELGKRDNPDRPYDKAIYPQVDVHLGDGRNFLRSTNKQYDLIIYALVDSLVLHSGYSNIRLESYLFTRQAFQDVRARLKPDGLLVMYNYFRQGWIVARLNQGLEEVFGADNPVFLCLPSTDEVETVHPTQNLPGYFTMFMAGDTQRLKEAFGVQNRYYLPKGEPPGPHTPNGFVALADLHEQEIFRRSKVGPPDAPIRTATDDWPFVYLRRPMIPDLSIRGALLMGGIALVLLLVFLLPMRNAASGGGLFDAPMFFLGAGFMLIETKAVVHMALLFGSTWMVNSVVFFAILVMILGANLFVLKAEPENLWPYYAGLFVTLLLNVVVPLDYFLGMNWAAQVVASCALVFAPILFAGVIFAVKFRQSDRPDLSFGANIAGAMVGGLAEYSSMLLGFQYLEVVALAFYALSALSLAGRGPKLLVGTGEPGA
jgi:SAM-dependent methyltransferase